MNGTFTSYAAVLMMPAGQVAQRARRRSGRGGAAQQLIDEANAEPSAATVSSTRLTEAKLLARRGQFAAARQLVGQAEALLSPTVPTDQTDALMARAEVERLAGAPDQARGQPARRPADL
jgi:hypothetical protein